MKRKIIIGIGLLMIAGAVITPLLAGATRGDITPKSEHRIPPIDASRPAVTETATFSLG